MLRDLTDLIKEEKIQLLRSRAALLKDWKTGKIVGKLERLAARYDWACSLTRAAEGYFPKHNNGLQELTLQEVEAVCSAYDWCVDHTLFLAEQKADDVYATLHAQRGVPYLCIHPKGTLYFADVIAEVREETRAVSKKNSTIITRGLTLSLPAHPQVLPNISILVEKNACRLYARDDEIGVLGELWHKSNEVLQDIDAFMQMQKIACHKLNNQCKKEF